MKDYKKSNLSENVKTYKKVEKYSDKDLKKEIDKLNKYYKNKARDNILRLKEY